MTQPDDQTTQFQPYTMDDLTQYADEPDSAQREVDELFKENRRILGRRARETTDQANHNEHMRAQVDLSGLQMLNRTLTEGSKQPKKTSSRIKKTSPQLGKIDRVQWIYLGIGAFIGVCLGMIIAGLLEPELTNTRANNVSGWITAVIVLITLGFGAFLGSLAHDKWRR